MPFNSLNDSVSRLQGTTTAQEDHPSLPFHAVKMPSKTKSSTIEKKVLEHLLNLSSFIIHKNDP